MHTMNPVSSEHPQYIRILGPDHPSLREIPPPLPPVEGTPEEIESTKLVRHTLSKTLREHMLHYNSLGISAPQLRLPHRMFVMGDQDHFHVVINPFVVGVSKETCVMEETCVALPGVVLALTRPESVTASYETEDGEIKVATFSGLAARIFLHEYDYMVGRSFLDWASRFKLERAFKSAQKKMVKQFFKQFRQTPLSTSTAEE
jgi:peptide deformylase